MKKKYVSNSGCFAKLSRANVVTKRNFDAKIIELENIIKKLQIFDSSYFRGESHFEEDGTQIYLIFQALCRYFKVVINTDYVLSSKSKDYLMKVLNHQLHLIIILLQHCVIMIYYIY